MTTEDEEHKFTVAEAVRSEFGKAKYYKMTKKTHPKVMRMYSQLCTEKNLPEYPIYVVKSNISNAYAFTDDRIILITTSLINERTPAEVCADLGHEGRHMTRRQLLRGATLPVATMIASYLPLRYIGGKYADDLSSQRNKGNEPSAIDRLAAMGMVAVTLSVPEILGALTAQAVLFRNEYDADIGGAEFAGKQNMIDSLRKDGNHGRSKSMARIIDFIGMETHPSNEARIRNIERNVKER